MDTHMDLDDFLENNPDVYMESAIRSGESSKTIKRMVSYFTDDPLEYNKKYGILEDIIEDKNERWSKYLPDTQEELSRVENQRVYSNKKKPGYCKVGTVELEIPPIQISVSDIKNNHTYKTLRTNSDIVFSSGHANKIIEMDVYFNGIDDINSKLRPMLAQLKASPFTPIYSEYIRTLVIPSGKNMVYKNEDGNIKTLEESISDSHSKILSYKKSLLETISKPLVLKYVDSSEISDLSNDINLFFDGNQEDGNYKYFKSGYTLSENMDIALNNLSDMTPKIYGDISSKTSEVEKMVGQIKSENSTKISDMTQNSETYGNLAAVLSQLTVSTVQGFPESILCHFTFFVFNYYPFSQKFDFISWDNKPTFDIDNCEYFIKWYSDRFLSKKSNSGNYMKKLDGSMNGSVKISFEYSQVKDDGSQGKVSSFSISTDNNNVCSAITVSNSNNIAFLPILAWQMPTCQYLGSDSPEVILSFDSNDEDFIDGIKFFGDIIDFSSRSSDKKRRSNFVTIDNEILLLNGIKKCIIQSIDTTTVPGSPGITRINMKLIEYNVRQLDNELILLSPGATRDRMIALFDISMDNIISNNSTETDDFPVYKALREVYYGDYEFLGAYYSSIGFYSLESKAYQESAKKFKVPFSEMESNLYSDSVNISDEFKMYLINSDAMKLWKEKKTTQLLHYINGTFSNTDQSALSGQEIKYLEEKGLDKYQGEVLDLYPDMDLPEYESMPYLERPSYSTLGISPPTNSDEDMSPRGDSDKVEPDFYFNNLKLKKYVGRVITYESPKTLSFWEIIDEAWKDSKAVFSKISDNIDKHSNKEIEVFSEAVKIGQKSGTAKEITLKSSRSNKVDRIDQKESASIEDELVFKARKQVINETDAVDGLGITTLNM